MRGNTLATAMALAIASFGHGALASVTLPQDGLRYASLAAQASTDLLAGQSYHWTLTQAPIEGMTCQETWRFNTDGTVTFRSHQEVTTHRYELDRDPTTGIVLMTRHRLSSNGAPDCTGGQDPTTGQVRQTILRFDTTGGFLTCNDATIESCFGKAIVVRQQVALK